MLNQQTVYEAKFKKKFDRYTKCHTIYRNAKKDWRDYHTTQLKLREKIQATVAIQKAAKLRAKLPIRTWLKNLKASMAPSENMTKRSIFVEYHQFMNHSLHEWPQRDSNLWLAKWKNLMTRAEQFGVSFDN